eukprot:Amastigsp_a178427_325.p3 type:complete len:138 gc:universal Amastigsp_a178427_325:82-495(+)
MRRGTGADMNNGGARVARSALFGRPQTDEDRAYSARVASKSLDMHVEQNDRELENIREKVSTLRQVSVEIHNSLDAQTRMLGDMQVDMNSTNDSLTRTIGKLGEMISSGSSSSTCMLALFLVALFFTLYYIAGYLRG